ncbi:MAG TPA: hypothetical protein VE891_08080 [Allosphingosinicella sp.]|nr:hypothetical protein [Allosphingosinicella sp.]
MPGNSSKRGGRGKLPLLIDWQTRMEQVWKHVGKPPQTIKALLEKAGPPKEIGSDKRSREKLKGKQTASEAFARAIFEATGFDALGLTYEEWTAQDSEWTQALAQLAGGDSRDLLDKLAEASPLSLDIDSTPDLAPPRLRRAGSGPPPEQQVFLNEYYVLHAQYSGPAPLSCAHLLLLEWSDSSLDWQVFSAVPGCRLDPRRTYDFAPETGGAGVRIDLGVRARPPREEFDLYLLAQRSEFDHRALSIVDRLGEEGLMSQREMLRLLSLLTEPDRGLLVAKRRYAVQ